MIDRESLIVLLGKIWNTHAVKLEQKLKANKVAITADQYRLLSLLWERDGAHQEYYARLLGRDRSALSRMLHLLESRKLLIREDDELDQRVKLIKLTEAGKKLQPIAEACALEVLYPMWEGFASEEREQLAEFLQRLTHNLRSLED